MTALLKLIEGKKTFIAGGLMVLVGWLQGDSQTILNGLAICGLRDALRRYGI